MLSRTLLLVGIFCLPHQTGAFWPWNFGSSTNNNAALEDNIAIVVLAETNRTDAYCSTQEHDLIQEKLVACVTDDNSSSKPYSWFGGGFNRRTLKSRAQCIDLCSGFPLGLKDTHCWLVNPSCQRFGRRAMTQEGEEQATSPTTVRRNLKARQLFFNSRSYADGFANTKGKWKSWNQASPDAKATCAADKEAMERVLPDFQYDNGLSTPCKLLMKDHFAIGCLDITQ